MSYLAQSYLVNFLVFLLKILPISVLFFTARRVGDVSYLLMHKRRKIALANIEKAFGDSLSMVRKKFIIRCAFQNAALAIVELFLIRKIAKEAGRRFTMTGAEILEKAFAKGKGVVLVISHLGSWEYLCFLAYITGQPWAVVVKHIKNPYVDAMIDDLRRSTGVIPIAKVNSIKTVLKELKNNRGIAILIDQWAGPDGLWIDFFHTPTSTTSIPARLAMQTGCALVPACCLRRPGACFEIRILPEVRFDAANEQWEMKTTEELNHIFEKLILEFPEQWLWAHRRWKDKPAHSRTT